MDTRAGPRQEAERREHLTVVIHPIARHAGGAIYVRHDGDRATIVLAPGLTEAEANYYLAHELGHDDFGVVQPPATDATMAKVEAIVDRRASEWLVPIDRLVAMAEAKGDDRLTAGEIAEEFGVPVDVADAALSRLRTVALERQLAQAAAEQGRLHRRSA